MMSAHLPTPPADARGMRRPRHALVRARQALLELLLPRLHYRLRRRFYSRSWARDDYYSPRQFWFLPPGVVPRLLKEAVDTGWFGDGGRVLDIGCGNGAIAAWLANAGFDVLGIDFAAASIARARASEEESNRLRFDEVDICEQVPSGGPFDALFDRGCYHGLPKGQRSANVRGVVACSRAGTRMLLMLRVTTELNLEPARKDQLSARMLEEVRTFFTPAFAIERIDTTCFNSRGDDDDAVSLAGIVVWMIRQ